MVLENKAVLQQANAAISSGDHEGFLAFCAEDITWTTVGEDSIHGKQAVRAWMDKTYVEPPRFSVDTLIAEGDFVTALGDILVDAGGHAVRHLYCDVWRFAGGKMAELKAFVVKVET